MPNLFSWKGKFYFLLRIKYLDGTLSQQLSCVFENLVPHVSSFQAHAICLHKIKRWKPDSLPFSKNKTRQNKKLKGKRE